MEELIMKLKELARREEVEGGKLLDGVSAAWHYGRASGLWEAVIELQKVGKEEKRGFSHAGVFPVSQKGREHMKRFAPASTPIYLFGIFKEASINSFKIYTLEKDVDYKVLGLKEKEI